MIVDDRLDTVLRTEATGQAAARTQFRQLIDILDRLGLADADTLPARARDRFDSLRLLLGETERAAVVEAARLRSPAMVAHFAGISPRLAASAVRSARLSEQDWLALVPRLPVSARGFLRHRRDLGPEVDRLLARFGIGDAALPLPEGFVSEKAAAQPHAAVAPPRPAAAPAPDPREGIGAIVRRIEEFRRQRGHALDESTFPGEAPHLPFPGEFSAVPPVMVDFACDADGTVVAASGQAAPMLVGHRPFATEPDAPARCDATTLRAVRERRPVSGGRLDLEGAPAISGAWRIDAVPCFSAQGGRFTGWQARIRRPAPRPGVSAAQESARAANDDERDSGDRLRQMLHELRTPINAIQGFAELIHQQVMGPVSNQYRSYAAHIAGDAARMLAGFEEVDRLVKLETGRLGTEQGEAEVGAVVRRVLDQVRPLFEQRSVRLRETLTGETMVVALTDPDLEELVWRLLSVIAATAAPGERLALELAGDGEDMRLSLTLPATLATRDDAQLFAPAARGSEGTPSSLLGNGFSLRLAAAEARSVGGTLLRSGNLMTLRLPILTAFPRQPTGCIQS
ncbi:MAG: HAMP domain-containing histidine kinase [Sphingomonadales bacterium]|nr:HAMP domain-containing histidine kinase [Sphingomonadales bacterium]